ncbi:MAG: BatD family protein [Saprospiraceae bacterium]|nr:BatD family protein [Saprospiraceae bacterium]
MLQKARRRKIGNRLSRAHWMTMGLLVFSAVLSAQEGRSFYLEVAADTVGLGDVVEVRYTAENLEGQFVPPDFDDLVLIAGPNQSSSFQFVNGHSSQQVSHSYFFKITDTGDLSIPMAQFETADKVIESKSHEIYCMLREDSSIREHRIGDQRPRALMAPPKKKLKTRKI